MALGFQFGAFQSVGFQDEPDGVTPPVVVTQTITGAGIGRRRRYVLPDNRTVYASDYEIQSLLREFTTEKPKNRYAPTPKASKPAIVTDLDMAELVRFTPVRGETDVVRVRLSPKLEWRPSQADLLTAIAAFGMKAEADDEEAAIMLLLH